ncbi:unnamed protein product [Oikopleura dioica]|uniref:Uncharacterized protein n=1 Tax=Oikopleura dioica TaxID=34765 RepID=E4XNV4_OIKDI|nr:unnamed protein product [Oikopleura dioica]
MSEYEDETSMMNNLCLRSQKMQYNRAPILILRKKSSSANLISNYQEKKTSCRPRGELLKKFHRSLCDLSKLELIKTKKFSPFFEF